MRAVNLLPPEQRKGAGGPFGRSDGGAYVLVGFVTGLCLLGVVWLRAHHQIATGSAQASNVTNLANQSSAQAAALTQYENFDALSQARQQAITQLASSRFDWAHAFHELGRVLPDDVALVSVQGTMTQGANAASAAAVPPPATPPATSTTTPAPIPAVTAAPAVTSASSATPPGSVPAITVQGCTTSQAAVALAMQRLQLIDGAADVQLQSSALGSGTSASSVAAPPVSGTAGSSSTSAPYCPDSFVALVTFAPLPDGTAPVPGAPVTGTPVTGTTGTTGPAGTTGAAGALPATGTTGSAAATTVPPVSTPTPASGS